MEYSVMGLTGKDRTISSLFIVLEMASRSDRLKLSQVNSLIYVCLMIAIE